jgi:hypothetical protein
MKCNLTRTLLEILTVHWSSFEDVSGKAAQALFSLEKRYITFLGVSLQPGSEVAYI